MEQIALANTIQLGSLKHFDLTWAVIFGEIFLLILTVRVLAKSQHTHWGLHELNVTTS